MFTSEPLFHCTARTSVRCKLAMKPDSFFRGTLRNFGERLYATSDGQAQPDSVVTEIFSHVLFLFFISAGYAAVSAENLRGFSNSVLSPSQLKKIILLMN